jgi:hypothetical protein
MEEMADTTLTTSQVARHLGVSAERVRQYTRAGRLAPLRTPLGSLYSLADVNRFAQQKALQRPNRDPRVEAAPEHLGTVQKRPNGGEAIAPSEGLPAPAHNLTARADDGAELNVSRSQSGGCGTDPVP